MLIRALIDKQQKQLALLSSKKDFFTFTDSCRKKLDTCRSKGKTTKVMKNEQYKNAGRDPYYMVKNTIYLENT